MHVIYKIPPSFFFLFTSIIIL